MSLTLQPFWPGQNLLILYTHFHQLEYFLALNPCTGFCSCEGNREPRLSKLHRI